VVAVSTDLATRNPSQDLVAQVRSEAFQQQVALALPDGMKPSRFVRVMATAVLENPELATKAEIQSVFQAGLRAAADGLLPDGREAAFVLFGNRCTYMPMVGGLRKIAADFGWSIRSQVVYAGDEFDYSLGMEPRIDHRPARFGTDRGDPVGAYAVGKHKDGRLEIEVLTIEDVEKVRAVSRSSNRGPWVDWWDRMAEKSAARRLFAKLPLGERDRARIASVLEADELAPGEAKALLYGRDAPIHEDAPVHREADGDLQGSGEVVNEDHSEAERAEKASSGSDGTPAPAAAAEPVDALEEYDAAQEVAEAEEGSFTVPASVGSDADVTAANEAGGYVLEVGKHKGARLAELIDSEDGLGYLKYVLRQWKTNPLKDHAWAFAKVYAPDLYEECAAASAEEGS
jgi:phage RecT family recombinase